MRASIRYVLPGVLVTCTSLFAGCMSQKAGAGIGAVIVEAAFKASFDPVFELAFASNEFRETKKRWPKDYEELSNFLKQSDDKTYRAFRTVTYQRIDFAEAADGKLRINAEFTFDSSGTGKIEGMEISAFDSHPAVKKSQ